MAKTTLKYEGPSLAVEIPDPEGAFYVQRGETFEVDATLADDLLMQGCQVDVDGAGVPTGSWSPTKAAPFKKTRKKPASTGGGGSS